LFTKTHEALIHKAEAGHNSNLRRISENLDIPKITGHTPRHTKAGHLQAEVFSVEEIQRFLVHSNSNTTKVYLKQRYQTDSVNQTMAVSIKIFRSKRTETNQRRY
jgi:integrase